MHDKEYVPKKKKRLTAEFRFPIKSGAMSCPDMVIAGFRIDGEDIVIDAVRWEREDGKVFAQIPWSR